MKRIISAVAVAGLFSLAACNHSAIKERDAAIAAQQHTIDSMNDALAKQHVIDSMNEVVKTQYVLTPPAAATTTTTTAPARSSSSSRSRTRTTTHRSTSTAPAQQPVVYQQAPAETKKKGWSAKAKGAVIGTATGAAAGAIINGRNRAAGAVIGGVLGAAAGTGVGAIIDKKHGR